MTGLPKAAAWHTMPAPGPKPNTMPCFAARCFRKTHLPPTAPGPLEIRVRFTVIVRPERDGLEGVLVCALIFLRPIDVAEDG